MSCRHAVIITPAPDRLSHVALLDRYAQKVIGLGESRCEALNDAKEVTPKLGHVTVEMLDEASYQRAVRFRFVLVTAKEAELLDVAPWDMFDDLGSRPICHREP